MDKNLQEYPYVEEYQGSYIWLILVIAAFLLFFIVVGITYSLYDNTIRGTKNPISTNILLNYSDVTGVGNGISIQNAKEMSDLTGKKLTGIGNLFEFTVSGNTKNVPSKYTIVLEEGEGSTMPASDVKVYLAKTNGSIETELFDEVPVYSSLEDVTIDGNRYKKIYSVSFDESVTNFSQDYVLKMWIREGATDYYGKVFSLKVNVFVEGIGE